MATSPAKPECTYCGATDGLGVWCDGGMFAFGVLVHPVEYICENCFIGTDTGPSFDDLEPAPSQP